VLLVRLEGLGKLKQIHIIGSQIWDLPAFSIVPKVASVINEIMCLCFSGNEVGP
jgi:hypothetical protein